LKKRKAIYSKEHAQRWEIFSGKEGTLRRVKSKKRGSTQKDQKLSGQEKTSNLRRGKGKEEREQCPLKKEHEKKA